MPINKVRTKIDLRFTNAENKQFELRNIELNDHTQELVTILRLITAAEFPARIRFPLPKEWFAHHIFITEVDVHNEGDHLVFTIGDGTATQEYPIEANDFFDYFDLDNKYREFSYRSHPVTVDGEEGVWQSWTTETQEILITDRQTFVLIVDREDNMVVDSFWHIGKMEVFTDCCLMERSHLEKLLSVLPEAIHKAMADNTFHARTLKS